MENEATEWENKTTAIPRSCLLPSACEWVVGGRRESTGTRKRLLPSTEALARNGGSLLSLGVESTQLRVGFDVRREQKRKQV